VKIKSYTDLIAWQRAHDLTLYVFDLTDRFPRSEQFGIVIQARRAAASVPANIAEGFGRGTPKEMIQFLRISRGGLEETRYFMILSRDRNHISPEELQKVNTMADSVGQLLNALIRSLRSKSQI